jgi:hypothetical protein
MSVIFSTVLSMILRLKRNAQNAREQIVPSRQRRKRLRASSAGPKFLRRNKQSEDVRSRLRAAGMPSEENSGCAKIE